MLLGFGKEDLNKVWFWSPRIWQFNTFVVLAWYLRLYNNLPSTYCEQIKCNFIKVRLKVVFLIFLVLVLPNLLYVLLFMVATVSTQLIFFFFTSVYKSVKVEMVFCYQNCSDLLGEKFVLGIEKKIWNLRLKAEN